MKAEWVVEITKLYDYSVFYGDFLRCAVLRERFVGLGRLEIPAFLRFRWRNNKANNGESKTHLKRPWIAPKLHTRHKDNPKWSLFSPSWLCLSILRTKFNFPYKLSYFATRRVISHFEWVDGHSCIVFVRHLFLFFFLVFFFSEFGRAYGSTQKFTFWSLS